MLVLFAERTEGLRKEREEVKKEEKRKWTSELFRPRKDIEKPQARSDESGKITLLRLSTQIEAIGCF